MRRRARPTEDADAPSADTDEAETVPDDVFAQCKRRLLWGSWCRRYVLQPYSDFARLLTCPAFSMTTANAIYDTQLVAGVFGHVPRQALVRQCTWMMDVDSSIHHDRCWKCPNPHNSPHLHGTVNDCPRTQVKCKISFVDHDMDFWTALCCRKNQRARGVRFESD